jgi:hypothetical protein
VADDKKNVSKQETTIEPPIINVQEAVKAATAEVHENTIGAPAIDVPGPAKSAPPEPARPPGWVDYSDPNAVLMKYGQIPDNADPKKVQAYHDRIIADAVAQQKAVAPVPDSKRYGVFASNPQKFVVQHEMVGGHPRGKEITYRDLIAYRDPKKTEVDFAATMNNVERLKAIGAIKPLVIIGS